MYVRAIFVLCLSVVHPLLCHGQIDDTRDILESLRIDPNSVLDHEVVEIDLPSKLHKRDVASGVPVKIKALDMDLNLLLVPTDSLFATDQTKVYKAYYTPKGPTTVTYKEVNGAMKDVGKIMEDPEYRATFILKPASSGKPTISGHLLHKKKPVVIKPLEPRVANKYMRSRRSINDLDLNSENKTYHLVAKLNEDYVGKRFTRDLGRSSPQRTTKPSLKPLPGSTNKNIQGKPNVVPPQVSRPSTLRPEMLLEIDYTLWKILESRGMPFLLEYILAYWNGVDMIFRDGDEPKIRLSIVVVIIAMDPEATPFIATSSTGPGSFDGKRALNGSGYYHFSIKDRFSFDSYDFASTMTALGMGRNGTVSTVGIAYRNGMCDDLSRTDKTTSVSLIHDIGGFSSILTAAHEVGHLFGLHHDNEDIAAGCTPSTGYVMTDEVMAAPESSWFSKCSLETFRKNYEKGLYECTYNEPSSAGTQLPKLMPGKMEALNKQCEALGHNKTCSREDEFNDICVQFWCETSSEVFDCTEEKVRKAPGSPCGDFNRGTITNTFCLPYRQGAAPGTPCGNSNDKIPKYCLKSRCVEV